MSGDPAPGPIERHPQYEVIVQFARNGPMVRRMRLVLVALAVLTFAGLRHIAPAMPILGAAAFGGFFLCPLLFTRPGPHARSALRALERREAIPATLAFENYDTDWAPRFGLRLAPDEVWRVRMDRSDLAVNDLAREPEHAVTLFRDPATGVPAAVLLADLLLWQFTAERA